MYMLLADADYIAIVGANVLPKILVAELIEIPFGRLWVVCTHTHMHRTEYGIMAVRL
jgi:hypothetical protein